MGTTSRRRSDRRKAWWSLALLPPAFVGAFVVGEGLVALYGFEAHGDLRPPLWVVLGRAFRPCWSSPSPPRCRHTSDGVPSPRVT